MHLYAAEIRDPTRPSGYIDNENNNPWELNAIIISADRRIAIINGNSVKVGDEISGQTVISIKPNQVTLDGPNGKMILTVVEKIKH